LAGTLNNKNAEWLTKDEALSIIDRANSVISNECYLLSAVAVECDTYRTQFNYIGEKFKGDRMVFDSIKKLTNKCEAIVATKTANGDINVALGIFILKAYHGLIETSKMQHEGGDEDKPIQAIISLGNGVKPNE
jgi:hypothetical protein